MSSLTSTNNRAVLKLRNFRSWVSIDLELPLGGCCHVTGNSGVGKSTIFHAIEWLLYGKLRSIAPTDYPTSQTKVLFKVQSSNFSILRCNKPSRVKVVNGDVSLEGQDAQDYIIKCYGSRDFWMASSYIVQSTRNRLLSVSESVKLNILSSLAFGGDDPEEYIRTLKDEISTTKTEASKLSAKMSYIIEVLEDKDDNWEEVVDQEISQSQLDLARSISKLERGKDKAIALESVHKKFVKEVATAKRSLGNIVEPTKPKETISEELATKCSKFKSRIETYRDIKLKISKCEAPSITVTKDELTDARTAYNKFDVFISKLNVLGVSSTMTFPEDVEAEIESIKLLLEGHHIELKNKSLNEEYLRVSSINSRIEELRQSIPTEEPKQRVPKDKIATHRAEIALLQAKYNMLCSTSGMDCPWCSEPIRITKDFKVEKGGHVNPELLKDELNSLKTSLTTLLDTDSRAKSYNSKLELTRERVNVELTKMLKRFEGCQDVLDKGPIKFDDTLILGTSKLEKLKKKERSFNKALLLTIVDKPTQDLALMKKCYEISQRIETLVGCLPNVDDVPEELLEMSTDEMTSIIKKYRSYERLLDTYNTEYTRCLSSKERLQDIISREQPDLPPTSSTDLLKTIKKAKRTKAKILHIRSLKTTATSLLKVERKKDKQVDRLKELKELLDIVKKCEYESLSNTTALINDELSRICSSIFKDPISATLRLSRTLASGKEVRSVGFTVEYRGRKHDSLNSMSGGEGDRISLALTIALHKLHYRGVPPILLIDETLSSVESNVKKKIIKILENMSSGLRLVVMHDDLVGDFAETLELERD